MPHGFVVALLRPLGRTLQRPLEPLEDALRAGGLTGAAGGVYAPPLEALGRRVLDGRRRDAFVGTG